MNAKRVHSDKTNNESNDSSSSTESNESYTDSSESAEDKKPAARKTNKNKIVPTHVVAKEPNKKFLKQQKMASTKKPKKKQRKIGEPEPMSKSMLKKNDPTTLLSYEIAHAIRCENAAYDEYETKEDRKMAAKVSGDEEDYLHLHDEFQNAFIDDGRSLYELLNDLRENEYKKVHNDEFRELGFIQPEFFHTEFFNPGVSLYSLRPSSLAYLKLKTNFHLRNSATTILQKWDENDFITSFPPITQESVEYKEEDFQHLLELNNDIPDLFDDFAAREYVHETRGLLKKATMNGKAFHSLFFDQFWRNSIIEMYVAWCQRDLIGLTKNIYWEDIASQSNSTYKYYMGMETVLKGREKSYELLHFEYIWEWVHPVSFLAFKKNNKEEKINQFTEDDWNFNIFNYKVVAIPICWNHHFATYCLVNKKGYNKDENQESVGRFLVSCDSKDSQIVNAHKYCCFVLAMAQKIYRSLDDSGIIKSKKFDQNVAIPIEY